MIRTLRSLLLLALVANHVVLPCSADDLVHHELAKSWMDTHGIDASVIPEGQSELEALVLNSCVAIELGGLRLLLPPEEAAHERTLAAFATLLDVNELWATWSSVGSAEGKLPKDVKKARKLIDKWCAKSLAPALESVGTGHEFFATIELDEKIAGAFDTWTTWVRTNSGMRIGDGERGELVLLPTRKSFVQFACFLGHVLPELQSVYWADDIANWSALDYFDTRVSPLSYASPDPTGGYQAEYSMDTKNKDGLAQHVALMGARSLIDAALGSGLDPMFSGGLANLAVIDLFESVDTKVDGDKRSNSTQGRSQFVPAYAGGQSSGGSLPPVSAESRWRADRGKEYFLRQLRFAQKTASKRVEEKKQRHLSFQLDSDDGNGHELLSAPLLHPSAGSKTLPREFFGDYAEMVRAYRVGFLHWLRDESGNKSHEAFQLFLEELAKSAPEEDEEALVEADEEAVPREPFANAIARVYEVPLSAEQPTEDDLEGRFLLWLAK